MKFNKEKPYRPLMIFLLSMIVLYVVVAAVVILDYAKSVSIRDDCRMICEFRGMDYEGVLEGKCACTPSVGARVYVDPSV